MQLEFCQEPLEDGRLAALSMRDGRAKLLGRTSGALNGDCTTESSCANMYFTGLK